jgi:hypothetical protein
MRSRGRALALVIAVLGLATFAGLRVLVVHQSLSRVVYWEEAYRLVVANEMLAGPRWPIWEYQADHYQGGSLVVALLATPIVAVLGATYENLKLVPIAFALATMLAWVVLLWRAAGPATAALGAWLLALAPPTAQIFQVHAMGSHAETALFTVLGFLLTLEILRGAESRVLPFGLGLVSGLGVWFCYTAASGVAANGLLWLTASRRRGVRRGIGPLLAGGLLGFAPWIAYNLTHGFAGLGRLTELFDPRARDLGALDESLGARVAALFGADLPYAFGFPDTVDGLPGPAAWAYYALGIVALISLARLGARAWRTRRPDALLAALIVLVVSFQLLAYAVSSFRIDMENGFIGYRLFAPIFPVVAGALAMWVARLGSHGRGVTAAGLALVVLGLGAYGSADLLRARPAKEISPIESGYNMMGLLTQRKYRDDPDAAVRLLSALTTKRRVQTFFGLGQGLRYQYELDGEWDRIVAGLERSPQPIDRGAMVAGIRWATWARLQSSRDWANAGFRPRYHGLIHRRMTQLVVWVNEIEDSREVAAAMAVLRGPSGRTGGFRTTRARRLRGGNSRSAVVRGAARSSATETAIQEVDGNGHAGGRPAGQQGGRRHDGRAMVRPEAATAARRSVAELEGVREDPRLAAGASHRDVDGTEGYAIATSNDPGHGRGTQDGDAGFDLAETHLDVGREPGALQREGDRSIPVAGRGNHLRRARHGLEAEQAGTAVGELRVEDDPAVLVETVGHDDDPSHRAAGKRVTDRQEAVHEAEDVA